MVLRDFILSSRLSLSDLYGVEEAGALVSRLCEQLLGCSPYTHIVEPEWSIPVEKEEELNKALQRLLSHEPIQYVLGYADFMGMKLRVSPSVLIPRPETEELCQRIIDAYAKIPQEKGPRRILDLCCGSGCISWAMAKAFPDAQVYAVDLSQEALSLARSQNIPGVQAPHFIQADVLDTDALCSILSASLLQESPVSSLSFDLVISNPPYVRDLEKAQMQENVLLYEPHLALFVPDDDPLRFYRKIASVFSQLGTDSSLCALEINEEFADEVKKLFGKNAYQVCSERDFRGKDRFVFAKKK